MKEGLLGPAFYSAQRIRRARSARCPRLMWDDLVTIRLVGKATGIDTLDLLEELILVVACLRISDEHCDFLEMSHPVRQRAVVILRKCSINVRR